jgi:hypothetical protein
MPSVSGRVDVVAIYAKNNIVKFMYIDANSDTVLVNDSKNVIYFSSRGISKHTTDTDVDDYYTFNVVSGNEITKVNVNAALYTKHFATGIQAGYVYNNISWNSDNQVSGASYLNTHFNYVKRLSGNHTIGFSSDNGTSFTYLTLDDDCKVWFVDEDDNITEGSVRSIAEGSVLNGAYVLDTDTYTVTKIFIELTASDESISPSGGVVYGASLAKVSGDLDLTLTNADTTDSSTPTFYYTVYGMNTYSGTTFTVVARTSESSTSWSSGSLTKADVVASSNNNYVYWAVVEVGGETITTAQVAG